MGRLRGFLWLIAGIVVAALAAGIAFIALSRATAEQAETSPADIPTQMVVVAATNIEVRDVLSDDNLKMEEVSTNTIPEGAVRDMEQAIGRIPVTPLYAGEVVVEQQLLDPNVTAPGGRMALIIAEDEVLMAFPAGDLLSQVDVLKAGDHVDFLFTYPLPVDRETGFLPGVDETTETAGGAAAEGEDSETVTFNLVQNVTIASVVRQTNEEGQETGAPRALLLTVDPQDALVLKYMKDVGANVDLVLRAPGAEGEFSVEPVDLDYVLNGYILPTEGQEELEP